MKPVFLSPPSSVLFASAAFAALVPAAMAAEGARALPVGEVLITGTLASRNLLGDLAGISATEISAEALSERQVRVVSDVLRDVPGIAVTREGTLGGLTQIRIRGSEGNHALVLIDGIEAGDPFQGEFDFASLIADDAARVEVLKGQQSALYGSDAIGGVVHYITLTGAEAPAIRMRVEGGSFGTYAGAIRAAGIAGDFDYALNGSLLQSDGTVVARNGNDRVGARNASASAKLIFTPAANIRFTAVGRYSTLDADVAPQDFDFPPDPDTYGFAIDGDNTTELVSRYGLAKAQADLLEGNWTHAFTLQGVDARRTNETAGAPTFITDGTRQKISYATSYFLSSAMAEHALTLAADHERETFRNVPVGPPAPLNEERRLTTTGLVAEYNMNFDQRFGAGAAYRHDWNSRFEDSDTFRLHAGYRLHTGTRLHAAYGTGFKAPTNFELFGFDPTSFIGNPDLKPETSRGWEAGAAHDFAGRISLGITYFDSRLENEIHTEFLPGFLSMPANRTTESVQRGIEFFASARLGSGFQIDAAYTWLDAQENGTREIRRPPHSGSLNLSWRSMDERLGAFLSLRYTGEQRDSNFTLIGTDPATLPDFVLVNAGVEWNGSDRLRIYARVENLFDADYEEVYTFRAPGRGLFVGVRGNV
jgi:vitamin B12 transporter